MTEAELIGSSYPVHAAELYGFGAVKVGVLRFTIQRYEVAGIGNLSVMNGTALFGLLKMKTVLLTPLYRDAPLFSYDRIRAAGSDTLLIELYNTLLAGSAAAWETQNARLSALKSTYSQLAEHELGTHWYDALKLPCSVSKKGKSKACTAAFDELYAKYLAQYLLWLESAPACDPMSKAKAEERYVGGLIENGGPSTDAFVKAIGRDKTAALFRKVLFGTAAADATEP